MYRKSTVFLILRCLTASSLILNYLDSDGFAKAVGWSIVRVNAIKLIVGKAFQGTLPMAGIGNGNAGAYVEGRSLVPMIGFVENDRRDLV